MRFVFDKFFYAINDVEKSIVVIVTNISWYSQNGYAEQMCMHDFRQRFR